MRTTFQSHVTPETIATFQIPELANNKWLASGAIFGIFHYEGRISPLPRLKSCSTFQNRPLFPLSHRNETPYSENRRQRHSFNHKCAFKGM
jgi:hypothetical protein